MNARKLTAIMDPIQSIKPVKDSTFAMLLEAQARGWEIRCAGLEDVWLLDGQAWGRTTTLRVEDDPDHWYALGDTTEAPLSELDVILMRKDPPFDMNYIFSTYVLERAQDHGVLVINDPQGLRDANEKAFIAWFPELVPPTMITRSATQMRRFIDEHEQVVVKPLDLMGGRSVFVTQKNDGNRNVILETVSDNGQKFIMLQKFLPEIAETGDRRIILIDGQPVPYALARIPGPDDHRGNMDAGASTEVQPLTDRELFICEQIGPTLRDKGLVFAGIDIIGEYMTELNVTSPTGIRQLERDSHEQIGGQLFDAIESRLAICQP